MRPTHLLAKRPQMEGQPDFRVTLPGHVADTLSAGAAIMECVGETLLGSSGLSGSIDFDRLTHLLARALLIHDLGKASHQFQRMVRGGRRDAQALRHEWLSVWMAVTPGPLRDWLLGGLEEGEARLILCAVFGHHLKTTIKIRGGSDDHAIRLHCDHPDFAATLDLGRERLGMEDPPPMAEQTVPLDGATFLSEWRQATGFWFDGLRPERRRLAALLKGLLKSADAAGSAVARQGLDPAAWVREVLRRRCDGNELAEIGYRSIAGRPLHRFQEQAAAEAGPAVFVQAGCGTGKTAAAYLWAARHARGRKLLFCYPTTGTATEGFQGHVVPSRDPSLGRLLHSRAEIDLERILDQGENGEESTSRHDALLAWDAPVTVATVDQVLDLLWQGRSALHMLPVIGQAALVFDEVHQYDRRLFATLLRFIETLPGLPVLLMSASLPPERLEELAAVVEEGGRNLERLEGPPEWENVPRYRLSPLTDEVPWDRIGQELGHEKGKVLWIVNQVGRAIRLAQEAQQRFGCPVLIYHGRYRYCDRVECHETVTEAFGPEYPGPVLAVTTQVAEVSLDIDATLLVSDLAPVPDLIQRLGRLNRHAPSGSDRARDALFVVPDGPRPYDAASVDVARQWLAGLPDGPLSQRRLERSLRETPFPPENLTVRPNWLGQCPEAVSARARDSGYPTVAVIRADDAAACRGTGGRPRLREVARYAIPMPLGQVKDEIECWSLLGHARVAPAGRIHYGPWGATWVEDRKTQAPDR